MPYNLLRIGSETRVNTTTEGLQEGLTITRLSDGRTVATWSGKGTQLGHEDDSGVFQQLFDAGGNQIGGEIRVNTTTEGHQSPSQIIALAGGRWATIWTSNNPNNGQTDTFIQIFDANGPVGAESPISATAGGAFGPRPAVNLADGGFVLTWEGISNQTGQEDMDRGFFAQRFDAQGNMVGDEIRINTSTEGWQRPSGIHMTLADGFAFVWSGPGTQPGQEDSNGVYMQRFDANFNRVGGETLVNLPVAGAEETYASSLTLADGGFVVAYRVRFPGLDPELMVQQTFNADGSKRGEPVVLPQETFPSASSPGAVSTPRMTQLADGGWMSAWNEGPTNDRDIAFQIYNADGTARGDKGFVNTTMAGDQTRTQTVNLADGGFVTIWSSRGTEEDGYFYQRFDAHGSKVGSETRLTPLAEGDVFQFSVTSVGNGHFAAVWVAAGAQPGQEDVFQQVFDGSFNRVGDAARISTSSEGSQSSPVVHVQAPGRWTVSWFGEGTVAGQEDAYDEESGSGGGVFVQHFQLNAAPTGLTLSGTVQENAAAGTVAGLLSASDADQSDALAFSIVDANGAPLTHPLFEIVGNAVKVKAGAVLDFETATVHTLRVKVDDGKGGTYVQDITVTVTNVVETAQIVRVGMAGNDVLVGELGNDVLTGGSGNDRLDGGSADDVLVGEADHDSLIGGTGSDILRGDTGNDSLDGGSEDDILIGGAGGDLLVGGIGNDILDGGADSDVLHGSLGKDRITTGSGKDILVFDTKPSSATRDAIVDFDPKGDSIRFDNAVFTKLGKKGTPKPAKLAKAFFAYDKAKDVNDYLVYNRKTGILTYDTDGSGAKKGIDIAIFLNKAKLTGADFFVV